ncbi:MAG TPA: hypothetical protein VF595_04070 [Tepidisphaeraceae bacterium]
MSTVIRKVVGNRFENLLEVSTAWHLRPQVEALETWLKDHRAELDREHEWVADIGFTHRPDALGGGPPLSLELFRMCLECNMEIYLSEYGLAADEA